MEQTTLSGLFAIVYRASRKVEILEIRDLLTRGVTLIVDPYGLKTTADDFLASYGGYIENLVAVAKDTTGRVFYPSRVAPASEEAPTFFADLMEVTEAVGITTGAFVNIFADAFFGADSEFKSYTADGEPTDNFVCPNKPAFIQHMVTVVKEVAEFPIKKIFLGNLGYAHTNYCYCADCRSEFTEHADLRHDFQIADPAANPALFETWLNWRLSKISNAIYQVINAIKEVKPDLTIIPTFPMDPEGGYISGVRTRLGLDFDYLAKAAKNVAIEVFPWTPILPSPGSQEFNKYIENLSVIPEYKKEGTEFVMTHWILEDEAEYNRAKALADAAGIDQIYSMLGYPPGYQLMREIRLGLSR